jgi:hypothetical protein
VFHGYASWLSALYYHWSIFGYYLSSSDPMSLILMLSARAWTLPLCYIPSLDLSTHLPFALQLPFLPFSPAYDQSHPAKASPLTDCYYHYCLWFRGFPLLHDNESRPLFVPTISAPTLPAYKPECTVLSLAISTFAVSLEYVPLVGMFL